MLTGCTFQRDVRAAAFYRFPLRPWRGNEKKMRIYTYMCVKYFAGERPVNGTVGYTIFLTVHTLRYSMHAPVTHVYIHVLNWKYMQKRDIFRIFCVFFKLKKEKREKYL